MQVEFLSSMCSATSGMALTLACAARTSTTGRTGRGGTTLRANLIDSSHKTRTAEYPVEASGAPGLTK
nr:MAG TPA: hypothetical protein [Caudoviricetes sp.]